MRLSIWRFLRNVREIEDISDDWLFEPSVCVSDAQCHVPSIPSIIYDDANHQITLMLCVVSLVW